jgi:hypothetical protein
MSESADTHGHSYQVKNFGKALAVGIILNLAFVAIEL